MSLFYECGGEDVNDKYLPDAALDISKCESDPRILGVFWYKASSRRSPLGLGMIILAGFGVLEIYSRSFSEEAQARARATWGYYYILIWASSMVAMCLWGWWRFKVILQPVTLTELGIETDSRLEGAELIPRRHPVFTRWSEVERIEEFHQLELDGSKAPPPLLGGPSGGIRLRAGNKKILIFRQIERFEEVCHIMKQQLEKSGHPIAGISLL